MNKKIAIVSDIHSNWPAFEVVLNDIKDQQIFGIMCLGDVIGYGPFPKECLENVLSSVNCRMYQRGLIRGNHEECVFDFERLKNELNPFAKAGITFTRLKIGKNATSFLANLPTKNLFQELDIAIAHGAWTEPSAWKYITDEESMAKEAAASPTHVLFLGHTHIPYVYSNVNGLYDGPFEEFVLPKEEKFVINVGSVGQPRDGDCRSAYGILEIKDNGEKTYTLRRVFYDIQKTADAILAAKLPIELAERLFRGE